MDRMDRWKEWMRWGFGLMGLNWGLQSAYAGLVMQDSNRALILLILSLINYILFIVLKGR